MDQSQQSETERSCTVLNTLAYFYEKPKGQNLPRYTRELHLEATSTFVYVPRRGFWSTILNIQLLCSKLALDWISLVLSPRSWKSSAGWPQHRDKPETVERTQPWYRSMAHPAGTRVKHAMRAQATGLVLQGTNSTRRWTGAERPTAASAQRQSASSCHRWARQSPVLGAAGVTGLGVRRGGQFRTCSRIPLLKKVLLKTPVPPLNCYAYTRQCARSWEYRHGDHNAGVKMLINREKILLITPRVAVYIPRNSIFFKEERKR